MGLSETCMRNSGLEVPEVHKQPLSVISLSSQQLDRGKFTSAVGRCSSPRLSQTSPSLGRRVVSTALDFLG